MKRLASLFFALLFIVQCIRAESWYKNQLGTGTGNCGPATVAMAVQWATGIFTTVEQIRDEIGYPYWDGSTSFSMLLDSLKKHSVSSMMISLASFDRILDLASDQNCLLIVMIDTADISMAPKGSRFGRLYTDSAEHFIIINGVVADYFMIEDPLNAPDCYYKISEVWKSMGGEKASFIAVYKR